MSASPCAPAPTDHQFARQLVERVAQAVAQASPWKQRPHTPGGAVKAIGESAVDPVRRLMLEGSALKHAIGLGQGCGTLRLAVPQMPDDAATDDGGQIHLVGETAAVFFIGQDIRRQRQATPGQHGHQTLLTQGTDQAIERHGRDVADHRTPFQTESTVGGNQGIAGHRRTHAAIAQDEVRQDGEHRFARGALDTPDGETTQADPGIMGVARQAPTLAAGGLMCELKAEGEEEGEDKLDKRLGITQECKVGRLIVKIDGDGAVLACRFGGLSHVSSPFRGPFVRMRHRERNVLKYQTYCEGGTILPRNSGECVMNPNPFWSLNHLTVP